ncbi:MAG: hypothetical protein ABI949_11890 [Ilumatobacteraceae bacterium]
MTLGLAPVTRTSLLAVETDSTDQGGIRMGPALVAPWQWFRVMSLWTVVLILVANFLLRRRGA